MASREPAEIYVASALTILHEQGRETLGRDIAEIVDAVAAAAFDDGCLLYAYDPYNHTAPFDGAPSLHTADEVVLAIEAAGRRQGADYSPEEIWRIDSDKMLVQADGLIVHDYLGGSAGVGMELLMAELRHIPVLYLHHHTRQASKMVRGMPGLVTVRSFNGAEPQTQLTDVVLDWIRTYRQILENGPRIRAATESLFAPRTDELRIAWGRVKTADDGPRIAESCMFTLAEIELLLTHPLRVANLPAWRLALLMRALHSNGYYPIDEVASALPEALEQYLDMAAQEYNWGEPFRKVLATLAAGMTFTSVSRQMTGRYNFRSMEGWWALADDWLAGRLG